MIVLDTDVVSELMRTEPDAVVLGWVDSQPPIGCSSPRSPSPSCSTE